MKLIIICILIFSPHFADEAELYDLSTKLEEHSIQKSNIQLVLKADKDIYGVQFDISYNSAQLILDDDAIISNIPGNKIYSSIKGDGIARILILSLTGEKLLDATTDSIADLIHIPFQSAGKFRGTSFVELFDITLAGRAGLEVDLKSYSPYIFE